MSTAGTAHQLGRYELPDGTARVLIAERINGRVALSDLPTSDEGRVFRVERHIESTAAMQGLVFRLPRGRCAPRRARSAPPG
jgi:hypothetical protein